MSARPRVAREPEAVLNCAGFPQAHSSSGKGRMVFSQAAPDSEAGAGYSRVDFGDYLRVSVMLVPRGRGPFEEQLAEVLQVQQQVLALKHPQMQVISQTIFLRD